MGGTYGVSDDAILTAWLASDGTPLLTRLLAVIDLINDARDDSESENRNDAWEAGYESGRETDD